MRAKLLLFVSAFVFTHCSSPEAGNRKWPENIQVILDNTSVLEYSNVNSLPLYLWPAIDPGNLNESEAEDLVAEFKKRGLGIICSWSMEDSARVLSNGLTIARAQKKLGQRVNINANDLMYSFFNGDLRTAHVDESGIQFFDNSFGSHKMGCPFTLDFRKKEIRDRFEFFVRKYKEEGLPVDFVFTDWEIDGPLEVNRAFEASKRCTRCNTYLGKGFTFEKFQKTLRVMRSYLQNYSYCEPILRHYPHALVGNYAVYPNDGYRYWYDYFEYHVDYQPYIADQNARYRKWYNDFPATGYTYAMPVCYPWSPSYKWYDFENTDYKWFYNMLLVASNAGKNTPENIPVISFVHWNTVFVTGKADTTVKQMSKESYQELLWHMLLRGTDTFFLWAEKHEFPEEVKLVHEVYAAAQQFGNFLEHGIPITFDVPDEPGVVISGLAAGDSVLIRRTDFGKDHNPVIILAGTRPVTVDYDPGICRIIPLK